MSDPIVKITDDMREIIRRAILCFVATVNPDGTPNLSPKASLTTRGDALLFANIASPDTVRNLRHNPGMEVNVVDVFARRGYRFAGPATVLGESDLEFHEVAAWVKATNGEVYPVFDVVRLVPSRALELRSPAYTIGHAEETTLVKTYRTKYAAMLTKAW